MLSRHTSRGASVACRHVLCQLRVGSPPAFSIEAQKFPSSYEDVLTLDLNANHSFSYRILPLEGRSAEIAGWGAEGMGFLFLDNIFSMSYILMPPLIWLCAPRYTTICPDVLIARIWLYRDMGKEFKAIKKYSKWRKSVTISHHVPRNPSWCSHFSWHIV